MNSMKEPLAIREDHDPFSVSAAGAHIPGVPRTFWPLSFLAFIRWTSYSCPHCRAVFRRDYWPYNVRLGTGQRICTKCSQHFDDGSREWPELRMAKKIRFLIPPGIQALGGTGLFCAILTLFIAPRDVVNVEVGVLVFAVFLSPVLLWCAVRFPFVLRSISRFKEHPDVQRRLLHHAEYR
jgi:hypothetical protein